MSNNRLDVEGDQNDQKWFNDLCQKLEGSSSNATTKRNDLFWLSVRLSKPIAARDPFRYSIFPIGQPIMLTMKEQKLGYTKSLLSRSTLTSTTSTRSSSNALLKACVHAIADLEDEMRLWYGNIEPVLNYIEMHLLDGCFILELLIRHYTIYNLHLKPDYQDNPLFNLAEDHNEDPIFKFNWILSAVRSDLALVQNQISFVILQKLFDLVAGRDNNLPHDFLVELASQFFQPFHLQTNPQVPIIDRTLHRAHLLNILLNIFRPTIEVESSPAPINRNYSNNHHQQTITRKKTFLQSATSLAQVGVKFTTKSRGNLLDINYYRQQNELEIPQLHITTWSESFFRNLLAFECCCPDRKPYVASYMLLLNRLMNDFEDVRLLERQGILINDMGSDKDVLDMFKSIGRQINVQDFYYQDLWDFVVSSYDTMWNSYRKELLLNYFKSPWAIISMIAAVFLLLMTLVQTICVALIYYQKY